MASAQILTNGKALYAYNGTEWVPLNTAGNLVNSTRWQKTTTAAQTSLSGNDDYGDSLIYTPGYEQLYLNCVLLARDVDYTATNGTTITGLAPLTAGHIIEVIAYNNINVGNTYTQAQIDSKVANTFERWVDTLSASATVLSGLDDNSNTLSYTPGLEQVYVNGILLLPSEYTATSGSSIVLSEAAVASDVIQVYALKNFRVPNTYTIAQTDDQFLTKTSASSTYLSQSSASSTYQTQATNGMVLLNTTLFSGVSSQSFNNVFSSTYTNYKILINDMQGAGIITLRLRASGTDISTSIYDFQELGGDGSSAAAGRSTSQTSTRLGLASTSLRYSAVSCEIFNPNSTVANKSFQSANNWYETGKGTRTLLFYGSADTTTACDGFTILMSSGNLAANLSVYGYNK